jgi:hypothetical protein
LCRRFPQRPADKKLKGKPGENRRRKATELPRQHGRNVSGAARFDRQDCLVCSFLTLQMQLGSRNASKKYCFRTPSVFPAAAINGGQPKAVGRRYALGGCDEAVAVTVQAALTECRGPRADVCQRPLCGWQLTMSKIPITMTPDQINAVYQNLCQRTLAPEEFKRQLDGVGSNFTAVDAVLYLPMYSMGMGQAGITRRIDALRALPFTIEDAVSGKKTVADIERLVVLGGKELGMRRRVEELFKRANEIYAYGAGRLETVLQPKKNWSLDDIVDPFTVLYSFTGVADKAALHILMDLGWGVVKPDRHICRFVSRLGGPWKRYFPGGATSDLRPALTLPFVRAWQDACALLSPSLLAPPASRDGVIYPRVSELSSRQVDILVMWHAQDRAKEEQWWRPKPVCGEQPDCQSCSVRDCDAREQDLA